MNKTSLIAAVAAAYATAIAVSFSIGFMLGPKQALAGDGEPGVVTSRAPASQGALTSLGNNQSKNGNSKARTSSLQANAQPGSASGIKLQDSH